MSARAGIDTSDHGQRRRRGARYRSEVADRLPKVGHRVEVIEQLPSAGTDPALDDLAADADVVKQTAERVGEPVVLVGHSYDGMVITELADALGRVR